MIDKIKEKNTRYWKENATIISKKRKIKYRNNHPKVDLERITSKVCSKCKSKKIRSAYYLDRTSASKMTSRCKQCTKDGQNNPEWKEQQRIRTRNYRNRLRDGVIKTLGNECLSCGIKDKRVLQVDHIWGGGSKELKNSGNGPSYYKRILKSIENNENKYQVLCANCNWVKRHTNNEK